MVLVAFRTGLYVTGMAEQLENVGDMQKSWSYVVPETSEGRAKEALAEFQASEASGHCSWFKRQNSNVWLGLLPFCSKSAIYQCRYFW
jgi:hypothetical protein